MLVYQCEDSLEGILSGVYRIYQDHTAREEVLLRTDTELLLFGEYKTVVTDSEKAGKVLKRLRFSFGDEDARTICLACAAPDTEKGTDVFFTIRYGLEKKPGKGYLFAHLTDPHIQKVFALGRGADRELHHLFGFLRFHQIQSLGNGKELLCARMSPKYDLLADLMQHFSERFPGENFVICDEKRGTIGVHPAFSNFALVQSDDLLKALKTAQYSEEERYVAGLFQHFCDKVMIEGRKNTKLQRSLLPLRFRPYMTEFEEE